VGGYAIWVKTNKVGGTGQIGRMSTSKRKIDGETLVGHSGSTSRIRASGCLGLFGTDASGTSIKDRIKVLEARNASDVLVGVVQIVDAGVPEAMVLEEALGRLC
jgi:hypothetical protein